MSQYLFTSESVTEGHPDKICDKISDSLLDAYLAQDPRSRVAVETMVKTGFVVCGGEVTSKAVIEIAKVARKAIAEIGYTDSSMGFDADTCGVLAAVEQQSPDIAMGVDSSAKKEQGAGDQGLMFGYAVNETRQLMPMPIDLSHKLARRLTQVRKKNIIEGLRPDGKTQVTVEYENDKPTRFDAIVVSTQHAASVKQRALREAIIEEVIKPTLPAKMIDKKTKFHINPTGRFVVGGPYGDAGLTGRKIIVDTYGGVGRHGGGAFSGKDPSKVDRSGAYAARYVAKNIVAAGLARRCEVQLSYAIGVPEPVSINVDTEGTHTVPEATIVELVGQHFDLTPKSIIENLDLKRPIYRQTSAYGHFGREEFSWEKTDKAEILAREAGL